MNPADALARKRLTTMLAIDAVCFVLAGAAIVGHVSFGIGWLLPAFLLLVAAGLAAQIWFVLGWMRAVKTEEVAVEVPAEIQALVEERQAARKALQQGHRRRDAGGR